MDLWQHAAVSASLSAGLYLATGDPALAGAFCLSGIFVDLDHVLDYVMEKGRLDLGDFFDHFGKHRARRLVLVLHAWEWFPLVAALWALSARPSWLLGLLLGWLVHLVLDQIVNPLRLTGYFFFYRAGVRFDARFIGSAAYDS